MVDPFFAFNAPVHTSTLSNDLLRRVLNLLFKTGVAMNAHRSTYKPRLVLHVSDMTGKRSANAVLRAVTGVGPRAKVRCDLATKKVIVEAIAADVFDISNAISSAGFMPTLAASPEAVGLAWLESRNFEAAAKPVSSRAPVSARARARQRVDTLP
jgi:hypothetical protein